MHETLKFDVTVRFALSEKLALKTSNVLIKMAFFVDFALFLRTIDGLLRYGTVRYETLENWDKNGLPTVSKELYY
jgi:hypothetical protein